VSQPAPRRRWARAGNVLLVVLVTALQLAAPRAGSPVRASDLLAGPASETVGMTAALAGGVALWWRRSRPVSVLAVCVLAYAVNAVMVPGVPPYAGWLALYAAGAYGRQAARRWGRCGSCSACCGPGTPASMAGYRGWVTCQDWWAAWAGRG
jgi:hypothetical protein